MAAVCVCELLPLFWAVLKHLFFLLCQTHIEMNLTSPCEDATEAGFALVNGALKDLNCTSQMADGL